MFSDIQMLRAVAAAMVLFYHAGVQYFLLYLAFCLWITRVFYVRGEAPLYRWATLSSAPAGSARQGLAGSST